MTFYPNTLYDNLDNPFAYPAPPFPAPALAPNPRTIRFADEVGLPLNRERLFNKDQKLFPSGYTSPALPDFSGPSVLKKKRGRDEMDEDDSDEADGMRKRNMPSSRATRPTSLAQDWSFETPRSVNPSWNSGFGLPTPPTSSPTPFASSPLNSTPSRNNKPPTTNDKGDGSNILHSWFSRNSSHQNTSKSAPTLTNRVTELPDYEDSSEGESNIKPLAKFYEGTKSAAPPIEDVDMMSWEETFAPEIEMGDSGQQELFRNNEREPPRNPFAPTASFPGNAVVHPVSPARNPFAPTVSSPNNPFAQQAAPNEKPVQPVSSPRNPFARSQTPLAPQSQSAPPPFTSPPSIPAPLAPRPFAPEAVSTSEEMLDYLDDAQDGIGSAKEAPPLMYQQQYPQQTAFEDDLAAFLNYPLDPTTIANLHPSSLAISTDLKYGVLIMEELLANSALLYESIGEDYWARIYRTKLEEFVLTRTDGAFDASEVFVDTRCELEQEEMARNLEISANAQQEEQAKLRQQQQHQEREDELRRQRKTEELRKRLTPQDSRNHNMHRHSEQREYGGDRNQHRNHPPRSDGARIPTGPKADLNIRGAASRRQRY